MIAPDAFLVLAERLLLGTAEEDWRSSVSRAYYAAFHSARDFMEALGFQVPAAEQAHGYLWLRLSNTGHPPLDQAGRDLRALRTLRNTADYELTANLAQWRAQQQVQAAREIMETLDDCLVEPIRTQVRDGMRDYEQNILHNVTWQGP
jgi:uncharacterized protein (UPF0332 family)